MAFEMRPAGGVRSVRFRSRCVPDRARGPRAHGPYVALGQRGRAEVVNRGDAQRQSDRLRDRSPRYRRALAPRARGEGGEPRPWTRPSRRAPAPAAGRAEARRAVTDGGPRRQPAPEGPDDSRTGLGGDAGRPVPTLDVTQVIDPACRLRRAFTAPVLLALSPGFVRQSSSKDGNARHAPGCRNDIAVTYRSPGTRRSTHNPQTAAAAAPPPPRAGNVSLGHRTRGAAAGGKTVAEARWPVGSKIRCHILITLVRA